MNQQFAIPQFRNAFQDCEKFFSQLVVLVFRAAWIVNYIQQKSVELMHDMAIAAMHGNQFSRPIHFNIPRPGSAVPVDG